MCSSVASSISSNACLANAMLLSFLVEGQASFLPGVVYSTLSEGAVVDLTSFCEVLFGTGWFDVDVICIALLYTRSVVKKNNISNPLFLAKLFQVAITVASKYHDDFSVYDKTYRQLVPQSPVSPKQFMGLQFFFLEQLQFNLEVCSQQVAAVRGIFGSMASGKDWIDEVMNVLGTKDAEVTLHDLLVIVQMSDWWLDLHPTCCIRPIMTFFEEVIHSLASLVGIPSSVIELVVEYTCTGAHQAFEVIKLQITHTHTHSKP